MHRMRRMWRLVRLSGPTSSPALYDADYHLTRTTQVHALLKRHQSMINGVARIGLEPSAKVAFRTMQIRAHCRSEHKCRSDDVVARGGSYAPLAMTSNTKQCARRAC